jgi:hypothetical protein
MSPRRQFIVSGHFRAIPIFRKGSQAAAQTGRLRLVYSSFPKVN